MIVQCLDIRCHLALNYSACMWQAAKNYGGTVQKIVSVISLLAAVTKDVLQDTSYPCVKTFLAIFHMVQTVAA